MYCESKQTRIFGRRRSLCDHKMAIQSEGLEYLIDSWAERRPPQEDKDDHALVSQCRHPHQPFGSIFSYQKSLSNCRQHIQQRSDEGPICWVKALPFDQLLSGCSKSWRIVQSTYQQAAFSGAKRIAVLTCCFQRL